LRVDSEAQPLLLFCPASSGTLLFPPCRFPCSNPPQATALRALHGHCPRSTVSLHILYDESRRFQWHCSQTTRMPCTLLLGFETQRHRPHMPAPIYTRLHSRGTSLPSPPLTSYLRGLSPLQRHYIPPRTIQQTLVRKGLARLRPGGASPRDQLKPRLRSTARTRLLVPHSLVLDRRDL
jgi:hypothetical protein